MDFFGPEWGNNVEDALPAGGRGPASTAGIGAAAPGAHAGDEL